MPSSTAPEASWSLTRRLALRFTAMACCVVALFAAWSAYSVYDNARDDLLAFMDHETQELALHLAGAERSLAAWREAVATIVAVSDDPACAFRLRGADGSVLVEDGPPALLAAVDAPIVPAASWRLHLVDERVAVAARRVPELDLSVELVTDASSMLEDVERYAFSASIAFLVAAALAGLGAWVTAKRGLRPLRKVVGQARAIDPLGRRLPFRVEDAPDEVREVAAALDALLGRIDEGLARMRTFTAGLAHELRSPLQNLIGETEVALLSRRATEEYEQFLGSHLEDLHALSDAVDNLVAYCRSAEPRSRELRLERFDVAAEGTLRLARERRSAQRRGVEVRFASTGDTELLADREGVLRVLRNLVGNAIEWSPSGGVVDVRVVGDASGVRIEVDDAGPGVPPALRERLFEPFVSGDGRSGRRGGYGLGLAICRSVALEHGGSIRHEALSPAGTRFVAEFPRPAVAPDAASDGRAVVRDGAAPRQVVRAVRSDAT